MSINIVFLFFLFMEISKSHIAIRFNRIMSIIKEQNYSLDNEYVNQRVDNPYRTYLRLGDPSQYIPSFLKTDEYSFFLSNVNCPSHTFVWRGMSKDLIYITPSECFDDENINEFHVLDSIFLEETNDNLIFRDIKILNCSLIIDNYMKGPQCFHIGSQGFLKAEETGNNLIDILFKTKYIKSSLYEYKIINDDEMHLNIGLDLNNEEIKNYKFIKPITVYESDFFSYQKWGLAFERIYINNYNNDYKGESQAELDIHLGCLLGNFDFHEYFKKFLKDNDIFVEPKICEQNYYIYFFGKDMPNFDKLKNFKISFYFKELNYNFSFGYQDLILEKRNGYYLLIAFEKDIRNNWKFGFPFFKKYKFIFDQNSKLMGFYCPNGCSSNNPNGYPSHKESNFNIKKFLMIFGIVFGAIVILIIGIFIEKYIYEVRKAKANELLDLYEEKENQKLEVNKDSEKAIN